MSILDRLVSFLFEDAPPPPPTIPPAKVEKIPELQLRKQQLGNWVRTAEYEWETKDRVVREPALYDYWSIQRSDPHELQKAIEFYALSGWHPFPDWMPYGRGCWVMLTREKAIR